MRIPTPAPGTLVWCEFAEDYAATREHAGRYFCANCGRTDHPAHPQPKTYPAHAVLIAVQRATVALYPELTVREIGELSRRVIEILEG